MGCPDLLLLREDPTILRALVYPLNYISLPPHPRELRDTVSEAMVS